MVACFFESALQWQSHHEGPRKTAFVRRAVRALGLDLAELGIPLIVRRVPWFRSAPDEIVRLMQETGCTHLHFNAEYPLNELKRDRLVWRAAHAAGFGCTRHEDTVVLAPGRVLTDTGSPYTVFTPFKRKWLLMSTPEDRTVHAAPQPVAPRLAPLPMCWAEVDERPGSALWPAGSSIAHGLLQDFCREGLATYAEARDFPAVDGTSRLSPHLSAGTVSARACIAAASVVEPAHASTFVSELIWREFYRHVIAQHPHVSMGASFHRHYDQVRWEHDPVALQAWKSGETGYPLVDAAMRQLASTGWMHNRLRMIAAMFLCKHLLIDWREGERFFMEQLVDADFPSNNGGWQWSASTGTDAAPYFRVFNPASQGQKFDAKGAFTRLMIPELQSVPDRYLFEPWRSGLSLNYPAPVVDHAYARKRAIDRFKAVSTSSVSD